jgi:hypothetical protein
MVAAFTVTTGHVRASPSDELGAVLRSIRNMWSSDFKGLVRWAHNGHPAPDGAPVFDPDKTEKAILALDGGDQHAVLTWLEGNGRGDLHSQGASDSDIGPAKPGVDADSPKATPTPNAWRNVPLATGSLDNAPVGQIQILAGFSAIKKDGTSAIACLSFKNLDPRVAKRVVFDFPLLGGDNQELGKLTLDRSGEFSPTVDIRAWESMGAWQTPGGGPKTYNDGCIFKELPTAALPFLQARAASYTVTHVEYADGTAWPK